MTIEPTPDGFVLTQTQDIAQPRDRVWAFFSRPENLETLTPKFLKFKILTEGPIPMEAGALIDYRISLFGLPMKWRTEITDYDPPNSFVDQQLKGPYARWHHTHTFEDLGDRTLMHDRVEYRVPLGPLGSVAHGLFVQRTLRKIFEYRREMVDTVFANAE